MIKWDAAHPIRCISSKGIYSEHWIGIAEKPNQTKTQGKAKAFTKLEIKSKFEVMAHLNPR